MIALATDKGAYSFVAALKTCARKGALEQGKLVHADIVKDRLETNLFIGSTLIDMYAKCASLSDAHNVFVKMPTHDVVSWSAMISGYAEHGHGYTALKLYDGMQQKCLEPTKVTFVCLLKACASVAALDQGNLINIHIIKQGIGLDVFVGSSLVNMYVKCGSLENARHVFDKLLLRNVVSWSAIIAGYAEGGYDEEALLLFWRMQQEGIDPDEITYVFILKTCTTAAALGQGKVIHADILERGIELNSHVACALIDMYAKCNSLEDARGVFDKLPVKSVVLWSVVIAGYAECGHGIEALQLLQKMLLEGKEPNKVTFICSLKACSSILAVLQGMLIHTNIIRQGLESEPTVQNALADMYIKFGSMQDAQKVFSHFLICDVVSWSTMIAGYAEHGQAEEALELYKKMQSEGTEPNEVTFSCILKACASTAAVEEGEAIHEEIVRRGLETDLIIGNALIDMYGKCGSVGEAEWMFENLPVQDDVSWNTIIAGNANNSNTENALRLFERMVQEGIEPNQVTFACILKACCSLAALGLGKLIHGKLIERGLESNLFVANSLVSLYAKCGVLEDAHKQFDSLLSRDVVSWNAIIAGYAEHGYFILAQHYFEGMQPQGIEPDDLTFLSLLLGCSHMGLVQEGYFYLKSMLDYGLAPCMEHYACMVDILGRAGHLIEAENLILKMPCQPGSVLWAALLGSCSKYENVNGGERAFAYLVEANSRDGACHVQMSNIYAAKHMWQAAEKIQGLN